MEEELIPFGTPQDQAIYNILVGGQSYQIGSRRLTRADLARLQDMQSKLQAQIASNEPSGLFADTVVAIFEGR